MATEYFSDLNYSLANEDTLIEYQLLPQNANRVFSIAGSGARCIPLIAKNPKVIDIIDMSEAQLYLVELRLQAIRTLNYEEYLYFIGYRGAIQDGHTSDSNRFSLFERLDLSVKCKEYWLQRKNGWNDRGFIFLGRWESHFQKLGSLFRDYLKCDFSPIFEAQTLKEQQNLYKKVWPTLRWKSFMRIAASEYVFNKFLYKGHFSGQKDKRTEKRTPYEFLIEEFERIFKSQLVRKNYFMQVLFLGKIAYEEGLPLEAQRAIFEEVKKSKTQINYHVGNLLDLLPTSPFDFVSLSDTISYLDAQQANQILHKMHPETAAKSKMVIRSFLKAPTAIDSSGWTQEHEREKEAHRLDGTGVYNFHIYTKS